MQLIPFVSNGVQFIAHTDGVWRFGRWPSILSMSDVLRSLCGRPDADGGYTCYEDPAWFKGQIEMVSHLWGMQIATMAILDKAGVGDDAPVSLQAAGSIAVTILERGFNVSVEDAAMVVQLNIGEQWID